MHARSLFPLRKSLLRIYSFGYFKLSTNPNEILSIGLASSHDSLESRYSSLLSECSKSNTLYNGRQIHAQIITNGYYEIDHLKNKILVVYVMCGSLPDAKNMFLGCEKIHPLPWNWMIRGVVMIGRFELSLLLYIKMLDYGVLPDKFTYTYVVKACCNLSAVKFGRFVHKFADRMGHSGDLFVGSSLIKLYAANNSLGDARQLFDRMPERDCVIWNVMIYGYARNDDTLEACELFSLMRNSQIRHNSVTFVCILALLASAMELHGGKQIHGLSVRCGFDVEVSVANTLLTMYSKCRCLPDARRVFDAIPEKDLVSWNGIIAGYIQSGCNHSALDLFREMQLAGVKPDSVTFATLLPSFSQEVDSRQSKVIHAYIMRSGIHFDAFVRSALIDTYFKSRDVELALKVFNEIHSVDVVILSAMISGYVLNGMNFDALRIFRMLLQSSLRPNSVTLASVLPACSGLAALNIGKELHCYMLKNDFHNVCFVGSALVDMYAKCGRLDLGYAVFEKLSHRDTVAWNTIITSCSQNGLQVKAIELFRRMGMEGTMLDCVTVSAALSACAAIPAMSCGKEIHGFVIKGPLRTDIFAESALIDMYAKCGNLVLAHNVFDTMHDKNEVSWNSIISAYGIHGHVTSAIALFDKMQEAGFCPDHITFLAILSACSHAGLVEEGFKYFKSMSREHGIEARMEHYACMVDIFGRAGRLEEALNLIRGMPFAPDSGIWGALLGASRNHGNVQIADLASVELFHIDPTNSGYYVLMANTHAVTGGWEDVLKVRSLMKERGIQKTPGCSWIEIGSSSEMFVAADTSHPESSQIYLLLRNLLLDLREAGYVPKCNS